MSLPFATDSDVIAHLTNTGGAKWSGTSISYAFPTTAWFAGGEATGFSAYNSTQKSVELAWIKLWDDLIVPNFVAGTSPSAQVKFANSTTGPSYAYAYYPGGWNGAGTVWLNPRYDAATGTNNLLTPTIGTWGYMALGHELGHAIGLSHPGTYNGGSPTYANDAEIYQDSQMYTIMSYFTSNNTGADLIASDGHAYFPQTPMINDVLAIQSLYGASTTTRTGNTVYGFHSTADSSVFNFAINKHPVVCIYDSAGNDTLDLSGFATSSHISLAPGTFSDCDAMTYNLSIARGVVIENATGGAADDTLTGNDVANVLNGGGGADTMTGGLGNDTYYVDNAGDTVSENPGEGTDSVISSVTFALGDNVENLTLTGTAAIDCTGNALDNRITGNGGNNVIDGGAGNDTMVGGAGNDTYHVDSNGDVVTEVSAQGTDLVVSTVTWILGLNLENLTLAGNAAINGTGNAVNNVITGNDADNLLDGAAGNDTLDGGAGNDTMIGGLGNDTFVVDSTGDVVTELALGGVDTVRSTVTYALGDNLENLTLLGSADIDGTGNSVSNIILGNDGANALIGGAGGDTLNGGAGADTMSGGLGNDTFYVDNAGDVVNENPAEGTDTVVSTITYVLGTNLENLTLGGTDAIDGTGNAGANKITGNSGNNVLDGGDGIDTMIGGLGDDTYYVGTAGDTVTELAGQGTDLVYASINYTLAANVENLTLLGSDARSATGNSLANVMTGNGGNDTLNGGAGNDTLIGGAGNDVLIGSAGKDSLSGGSGADTFRFLAKTDSAVGINRDVITDFSSAEGDKVDLSAMDANAILTGKQAFSFIGGNAFSHVAGELRFDSGILAGDLNGDGVADFEIELAGVASMTSADFV